MSKSYIKINYNLRPAKSVERKMLCEALRRLIFFSDLTKYKYVGFGSTFFTDFLLIHKSLGINDLTSIEKEEEDKDRFEFNRPYDKINLEIGDANSILPGIGWNKKIILWLDYDEKLKKNMLTDIGTFISRALAGSIILVTINVGPDQLPDKNNKKERYEQLVDRVGKAKIPIEISKHDLDKQNHPKVCHAIANNEIEQILSIRNQGLKSKLIYNQLFNFSYEDSTPMLSFGGILYAESDAENLKKCNFDDLDFTKCEKSKYDPFKIIVPNLTFKEMHSIDKFMPSENISEIRNKGKLKFLDKEEIKNYGSIYRYVPNFVEAEIH